MKNGSRASPQLSPRARKIVLRAKKTPTDSRFDAFYDEFKPRIERSFLRAGLDLATCEDLIQETFDRVYRSMDKAPLEYFLPWIHRIARRVFLTHVDRERRRKEREDAVERLQPTTAAVAPEAASRLETREDAELLRSAIRALPPKMRAVVLLRIDASDPSDREIAERLNIAVGTVKSHLSQARDRLRGPLAERFGTVDLEEPEEP